MDPLADLTMMITATFDQRAWRFRDDDGSQTAATWSAAQGAGVTEYPAKNFRIRFEVQETAGGAATGQSIILQYNRNGLGWNPVFESSNVVRLFASPHVSHGTATTNQLTAGTGTFVPGIVVTTAPGTSISFAGSDHTEVEWCVQLMRDHIVDNDEITFRVTVAGAVTATSTAGNATLTVSKPGAGTFATTDSATVEWTSYVPPNPGFGTFATSDSTDVSWAGEANSQGNFVTEDNVTVEWEGFRASAWGHRASFTDILDTTYEDDTVVAEELYRYRVASAFDGTPYSEWSDWVEIQAKSLADIGEASGSGVGTGTFFAMVVPRGIFAVTDETVVPWSSSRSSTATFEVQDVVEVTWMGYEPPNPVPTNLTATFIGGTELKVDWDSPLPRFTLRREKWIGSIGPL